MPPLPQRLLLLPGDISAVKKVIAAEANPSADLPASAQLTEQIVPQNRVDGVKAILPVYFFAFTVGAAVVGNADFVNTAPGFGQLGCDFRFESETVFTKIETLYDVGSKCFVAGFDVGEI